MKKLTLGEMQSIAKKKGGVCLSKTYKDSKTKLQWRCAKGHEWSAFSSAIKAGRWCRQCATDTVAAKRRIPLKEIQALAKLKGGQLLLKEYTGNIYSKLRWRCAKGHEWEASLKHIRKHGAWCRICAHEKQRLTIGDIKALARSKGGKCLSESYHGQKVKLQWRCAEGHEWEATPGQVRNGGTWCAICAGHPTLTLNDMKELAHSRGGKCLSTKYINAGARLHWRCANGHEWMASANSVRNSDTWCRKCSAEIRAARQRIPMDKIQAVAQSRGGKCLSATYESNGAVLLWQCARGHEWEASFSNVKNNKSWCPVCGARVSERICRGIFEALFETAFPKERFDWLKNERGNWMELDGYSEKLKVAFEYHGIQHYRENSYFHNSKNPFKQRQADDRWRAKLCHTNNVRLFEIPYTVLPEKMEDFIRSKAKNMEVKIPRQQRVNLEKILVYDDDPLKELQDLAIAKGGKCLSSKYVKMSTKMQWRCSEAHEWQAPAGAIKNAGQWCPRCGIKRRTDARRGNIEDMKALARTRGGECLSGEYINSGTKLRWRCAKDHEWQAVPSNVEHNKSWCPVCAGNRRE